VIRGACSVAVDTKACNFTFDTGPNTISQTGAISGSGGLTIYNNANGAFDDASEDRGKCDVIRLAPKGKIRARLGLVAHMDHPGFSIVSARGKRARALWTGWVLRSYFSEATVVVHTPDAAIRGVVTRTTPPAAAKPIKGETRQARAARLAAYGALETK